MLTRVPLIVPPWLHCNGASGYGGVGGGSSFFTDTFNRPNVSTWGPNWLRTSSNIPGGAGNGITSFGTVSGANAVMNAIGTVTSTQLYQITWIPVPVYGKLYNAPGVFVQFEFRSSANGGWGAVLRYNHDLLNTQTQSEGADYYLGHSIGRIDKVVGGGAQVVIGAATWVPVLGDIIRFECLTNGAQVTLQTIRNGAILQTINDATGTRILTGGPGMQHNSVAFGITVNEFRNFSCGPLNRLST